jgi:heptosyltransferase II
MSRVLFVQPQGLGDMIMTTPAITALKDSYPDTEIRVLVGNSAARKVLEGTGYCDRIYVFDKKRDSFKKLVKLIFHIRYRFSPEVCIITSYVTTKFGPLFSVLTGAKIRAGYSSLWRLFKYTHVGIYPPNAYEYPPQIHEAEANISIVRKVFPRIGSGRLMFQIGQKCEKKAGNLWEELGLADKNVLGIHPGAGKEIVRWPSRYFLKLIEMFNEEYEEAKCAVFLGPTDMNLQSHFSNCGNIIVIRHQPIEVVAALIRRCKIFVNADSGLGHVASAVGTPVVCIFGPGRPEQQLPYGDNVISVQLKPFLACMPCSYTRRFYNCRNVKCLKKLAPEEVFNAVRTLWEKIV